MFCFKNSNFDEQNKNLGILSARKSFKHVEINSQLLDTIPTTLENPEWFTCQFNPDWTNSPAYNGTDKSYGVALCFGLSTWWFQMAFCTTDNITYIRSSINEGSWSNWKRLNS